GLQCSFAIAHEKVFDWNYFLPNAFHTSCVHLNRSKNYPCIKSEQDGRAVSNWRGRDYVSAHRCAVSNLARAEYAQHPAERGKLVGHIIFNLRQRGGCADVPL